jgi:hypothetical protein
MSMAGGGSAVVLATRGESAAFPDFKLGVLGRAAHRSAGRPHPQPAATIRPVQAGLAPEQPHLHRRPAGAGGGRAEHRRGRSPLGGVLRTKAVNGRPAPRCAGQSIVPVPRPLAEWVPRKLAITLPVTGQPQN